MNIFIDDCDSDIIDSPLEVIKPFFFPLKTTDVLLYPLKIAKEHVFADVVCFGDVDLFHPVVDSKGFTRHKLAHHALSSVPLIIVELVTILLMMINKIVWDSL